MSPTLEVEQKYHILDEPKLRNRLADLALVRVAIETQSDIYFRHSCRDFRQTDEAFRIRQINSKAVVTYKGPRLPGTVKMRPEMELSIEAGESDQWTNMLICLGFQPLPAVKKRREVYRCPVPNWKESDATQACLPWQNVSVTVDDVEQLGAFAEIEFVVNTSAQALEAQRHVGQIGELLGLSQIQSRSYLSQLLTLLGLE